MPEKPSQDNKSIAHIAGSIFGGSWDVFSYVDEENTSEVRVLSSTETPEQGLTSFCTVGLSDSMIPGKAESPLGAEILGVSNFDEFGSVLATAGFFVVKDRWVTEPGVVFPDIVSEHFEDVSTPHLLFVEPYLWDGFTPRRLTEKTVAWLMSVPITNAERSHLDEHGVDALEDLLEKNDPDIVNLWRTSVV